MQQKEIQNNAGEGIIFTARDVQHMRDGALHLDVFVAVPNPVYGGIREGSWPTRITGVLLMSGPKGPIRLVKGVDEFVRAVNFLPRDGGRF